MHMLDGNGDREQVLAGVGGLGKSSPDTMRGYAKLSGAAAKIDQLDAIARERIVPGAAVTRRCGRWITVRTKAARANGASEEEIAEALGGSISLNAGAALGEV